jgi:uncharacterized protein with ParB-like and HNH nuclease domain
MQKYENTTISKIMEEINIKYFLPDIQRPYVWTPEQIYALYDSIMRGYPISTFLFWEAPANIIDILTPRYEFLTANKKEYIDKVNTDMKKEIYSLVLDGQQRLTSLFLTLKGNFVIKNKLMDLYLNILSGEDEDENGNLFEFKFFNVDLKLGNIFNDDNKIWIKVKHIYSYTVDFDLEDFISDYIKNNTNFELTNEQKRTSRKLWSNLKYHELINYYPEREASMDKVLDIFIRTNAGGTKLSKSDLLFSTIKRNWSNAREEFKTLINNINRNDKYNFNHDFVLKTCLVLFSNSQNDIKYSVGNINPQLIRNIENEWTNIVKSITIIVDLIDTKYKLSSNKVISSYNALIPLIYFVYKNKLSTVNNDNSILMKRWLIKILLNGIFGGQADTMLYISKNSIDKSKEKVFPFYEINNSIDATKKSFDSIDGILNKEKLKYNSSDSFLILSLLYTDINFNASYNGNLPQQDHIYSQSWLRENKVKEQLINSIFNIQFLDAYCNQSKSGIDIIDWLNQISQEDKQKHFIPEGEWNLDNFEEFLAKRKKLFKERLEPLYN